MPTSVCSTPTVSLLFHHPLMGMLAGSPLSSITQCPLQASGSQPSPKGREQRELCGCSPSARRQGRAGAEVQPQRARREALHLQPSSFHCGSWLAGEAPQCSAPAATETGRGGSWKETFSPGWGWPAARQAHPSEPGVGRPTPSGSPPSPTQPVQARAVGPPSPADPPALGVGWLGSRMSQPPSPSGRSSRPLPWLPTPSGLPSGITILPTAPPTWPLLAARNRTPLPTTLLPRPACWSPEHTSGL